MLIAKYGIRTDGRGAIIVVLTPCEQGAVRFFAMRHSCKKKGTAVLVFIAAIPVSTSEKASDPRARVTRPAGAGHTTCGRGSRDLRPRVAEKVPKRNGNVGERNGNTREPHLDCARFAVLVRSFNEELRVVGASRKLPPETRERSNC